MTSSKPLGAPTSVSADLLQTPSRALSALMLSLIALVGAFIAWAAIAHLEEITSGLGRVIPASKIQIAQNLEGGIVGEILVREGDMVTAGDVLLRIDPTQAGSSLGETRERIAGLSAMLARLDAEIDGSALDFPPDLSADHPGLIALQRDHYETRKRELESALQVLDAQDRQRGQEILEAEARILTLRRALEIGEKELKLIAGLAAQQAASQSELLVLEAKVNDIQGSLTATELALPRLRAARDETASRRREKLDNFRSDSLKQMAAARVELSALMQTQRGSLDKVDRTTVRAPATGIVKTLNVTTTGQVVQPGQNLVEIVPLGDTLLVEAQVRPQDIAFLRPGQTALVKITAYDFSLYGGLQGKLEHIGADSVTTEKGDSYYLIQVRTDKVHLEHKDESLPIIPGMVAEVDIKTGSKSVLGYLTKPLVRMRQTALTER